MSQTFQITNLNPSNFKEKIVALDTNVLYWTFYGAGISYKENQEEYSNFVQSLMENNAILVTTTVNINEFMHLVEKNEYEIYQQANKMKIGFKAYRKILHERKRLSSYCQVLYQQIQQFISVFDINFDNKLIENYIESIGKYRLDCLDFVLFDFCNQEKINYILTDDKDFEGYDVDIDIIKA